MLYLDSSALIKCYVLETGSAEVRRRFNGTEPISTSWLTYAEVVTVFGRKLQAREFGVAEYGKARGDLERDWTTFVQQIEVNDRSMALLPDLTSRYLLKSADALHLASALWLDSQLEGAHRPLEFGTADRSLGRISSACGLRLFDPGTTTS